MARGQRVAVVGEDTYPTMTTLTSVMITARLQRLEKVAVPVAGGPVASVRLLQRIAAEAQAAQRDAAPMWVRDVAVSWCERLIGLRRWT
jgi:hypothetical protein